MLCFHSNTVPTAALYAELNYHYDQVSSNDEPFHDCYDELPKEETTTPLSSPMPLKHSIPVLFLSFFLPLSTLLHGLWFDPRRTLSGMLLLITSISYLLITTTFIRSLVNAEAVQTGPLKKWDSFAYPSHLLILSCVMLKQQFVSMMTEGCAAFYTFKGKNKSLVHLNKIGLNETKVKEKTKLFEQSSPTNCKMALKRLALVSALNSLHSLSVINCSADLALS